MHARILEAKLAEVRVARLEIELMAKEAKAGSDEEIRKLKEELKKELEELKKELQNKSGKICTIL